MGKGSEQKFTEKRPEWLIYEYALSLTRNQGNAN